MPTGLFVRDFLLERGEGYPYQIWRELRAKREELGLNSGSYQSFRINYVNVLKRLGLIEEARREASRRPKLQDRIYYRIVRGRERDERWVAPQKALYGGEKVR